MKKKNDFYFKHMLKGNLKSAFIFHAYTKKKNNKNKFLS
jgi:hypothetical protein